MKTHLSEMYPVQKFCSPVPQLNHIRGTCAIIKKIKNHSLYNERDPVLEIFNSMRNSPYAGG